MKFKEPSERYANYQRSLNAAFDAWWKCIDKHLHFRIARNVSRVIRYRIISAKKATLCERVIVSPSRRQSGRPRLGLRNKFLRSVGARRPRSSSPIDPTLLRNSSDYAGRFQYVYAGACLDFHRLRASLSRRQVNHRPPQTAPVKEILRLLNAGLSRREENKSTKARQFSFSLERNIFGDICALPLPALSLSLCEINRMTSERMW